MMIPAGSALGGLTRVAWLDLSGKLPVIFPGRLPPHVRAGMLTISLATTTMSSTDGMAV